MARDRFNGLAIADRLVSGASKGGVAGLGDFAAFDWKYNGGVGGRGVIGKSVGGVAGRYEAYGSRGDVTVLGRFSGGTSLDSLGVINGISFGGVGGR